VAIDLLAELKRIVAGLDVAGLDYAVCGGLAVAIYGFVRATEDIDLVIRRRDIAAVTGLLRSEGYVFDLGAIPLPSVGLEFWLLSRSMEEVALPVDLLPLGDDHPFWSHRALVELRGSSIWVLGKSALIEMKEASQRGKDRIDIEELRAQSTV